jgi:hypothetical protein
MNGKNFDTYQDIEGMRPCLKRPIHVHAKQIQEKFRVNSLEGDYAQGKPGDYLIKGVDGENYICDKEIFEKTYDFTEKNKIDVSGCEFYSNGSCAAYDDGLLRTTNCFCKRKEDCCYKQHKAKEDELVALEKKCLDIKEHCDALIDENLRLELWYHLKNNFKWHWKYIAHCVWNKYKSLWQGEIGKNQADLQILEAQTQKYREALEKIAEEADCGAFNGTHGCRDDVSAEFSCCSASVGLIAKQALEGYKWE